MAVGRSTGTTTGIDLMKQKWRLAWLSSSLAVLAIAPAARGIIVFGPQGRNTSAPADTSTGWRYQGMWGGFLATPIAPKYFVTASHIGGAVGQTLSYNGVTYTTTATFDDPGSDLQLWKISGTFPSYAPLYTGSTEVGKSMYVFGTGLGRGNV